MLCHGHVALDAHAPGYALCALQPPGIYSSARAPRYTFRSHAPERHVLNGDACALPSIDTLVWRAHAPWRVPLIVLLGCTLGGVQMQGSACTSGYEMRSFGRRTLISVCTSMPSRVLLSAHLLGTLLGTLFRMRALSALVLTDCFTLFFFSAYSFNRVPTTVLTGPFTTRNSN